MINKEFENYLNKYFWTKNGSLNSKGLYSILHKPNSNEYQYLIQRYNDSRSIKESIFRIKYNIDNIPRCPVCGNFNNFIGGKKIYTKHCCCRCTQLDKEVRKKNEETNLKLYGVKNGAQSKQAKDKYIQHIREKYNDETITNAWQAKEVINKIKQTCLKKYGVTNFALTKEHRKKLNSKETINKRNLAKRKNHTFNTSIPEKKSYELIKEKYPDVLYQYKSELYPFMCDFYIPSLDLYIECNYHWTHGGHPYNPNDKNDIDKVNLMKSKNTKYYNNAINCWTIRDVNKRNIVKENNLNYIEFWNIEELKKWLYDNK